MSTTYTYDNLSRLLAVAHSGGNLPGSAAYTYDAAGNLLADSTQTYTWDAEGQLRTVTRSGVTTTFTHFASGPIAQRSQAGEVIDFLYDPAGAPIAHYDATNSRWAERYIRLGGRIIAYYGYGCPPFTRFFHADGLGSMRQATDSAGNYVESALDYPWGQVWVNNGNPHDQNFAGMPDRAIDLDLYLTGSRQLGMNLSRWLSPDWSATPTPVPYARFDNPQSLNLYSYVLNNPLRATDPTGHDSISAGVPGDAGIPLSRLPVPAALATSVWAGMMNRLGYAWSNPTGDDPGNESEPECCLTSNFGGHKVTDCGVVSPGIFDPIEALALLAAPGKGAIKITEARLAKVLQAHTRGGLLAAGDKSLFSAVGDVRGLIQSASSAQAVKQAYGPNFQRVVDAGRVIGTDLKGKATTVYTVITDRLNNLVTAFPGLPRLGR